MKYFVPAIDKLIHRHDQYSTYRTFNKLKKLGYLSLRVKDGQTKVQLTESGKKHLATRLAIPFKAEKPKRWDGNWRIVICDIYERRKRDRRHLQITLQQYGFRRLQDSVWVYPYPCEDLVMLLKAHYRIGKEIIYIVAKHIELGEELRKKFSL